MAGTLLTFFIFMGVNPYIARMTLVYLTVNTKPVYMTAKWDDDETINGFIYELNYGKYAKEERIIQNERITEKAA